MEENKGNKKDKDNAIKALSIPPILNLNQSNDKTEEYEGINSTINNKAKGRISGLFSQKNYENEIAELNLKIKKLEERLKNIEKKL